LNASYLVDAATTSFIASVGIWAAVVRRHWFLRFAVVGSVLALGLLVPAYEIVIEFAIQVAVISAGVALWRGATIRRPRMSLETVLLAMVVAAVAAAVVGAAPTFGWDTWTRIGFLGLTLGCMSLLSLWIACGRASLPVRLFGGALGVVVFIAVFHFGIALRDAYYSSLRGNDWLSYLVNCYRLEFLSGWLRQVAPSIILGVITFTTLLMFARSSGWFTEGDATNVLAPWKPFIRTISRVCLCAGFGVIAATNVYLLYRLCTPPALLPEHIPADNGFDDFVAAGSLPGVDYNTIRSQSAQDWSDADLSRLLTEVKPVLARLDAGLAKSSWVTCAYADDTRCYAVQESLQNVHTALELQLEASWRRGDWQAYVDRCCDGLRFAHECSRGHRLEYSLDSYLETVFGARVEAALGAMTPRQCFQVSARLWEIEQTRDPASLKLERDNIFAKRISWQAHMEQLIQEWNGRDPDPVGTTWLANDRHERAAVQLRLGQVALQAYWIDHGAPPQVLQALVPTYLPALPNDPMGDGPLKYALHDGIYRIYSVGYDARDNSGVAYVRGGQSDDIVVLGPVLPPLPNRWRRVLTESVARGWGQLQAINAALMAQPTVATDRVKTPTAPH
jgi:hypothetical protein